MPATLSGTPALVPTALTCALTRPESSCFAEILMLPSAASAPAEILSCVNRWAARSLTRCPDNSSKRVSPPVAPCLTRLVAALLDINSIQNAILHIERRFQM